MAYAQHLDTHYRHCTRYLVTLNGYPQIIPTPVMRKFITATQAVWNDAPVAESANAIERLSNFLDVPETVLRDGNRQEGERRGRSAQRKLSAAHILFRSALGQIRPRRIWAFNRGLRRSIYINVSHENLDNVHIARWLERGGVSGSIFMVHDLIPITHPEYVIPGAPKRHIRRLETIARNASCILANSRYTKDVLTTYLTEQNLTIPHARIAPLGVEDVFGRRYEQAAEVPPYFVCVGTVEPRKNHTFLLQVWARLVDEMGQSAPKLVIVGRRGWENENTVDLLERAPNIRSHVIESANLPDPVLSRLIVNSRGTLFPSYVEGYGLPVAESLALGTPAICSNIDVLHEIGGKLIERLDPLDGPAWIEAIKEYTHIQAPRAQLMRTRIAHYRALRWADHMRIFDNAVADLFKAALAA